MSSWKAGDFFRQLATVIIGIVVTFGGSALIQKSGVRKETRQILEMVREELQQNRENVQTIKTWLTHEYDGTKALRPYVDDPLAAPVDSLFKYGHVISDNRPLYVNSNALEVLKGSLQVEENDKAFLRDIFTVYDNASRVSTTLNAYIEDKRIATSNYFNDLDREMIPIVYESKTREDAIAQFVDLMKNPRIVQYTIRTANGGWVLSLLRQADELSEQLDATIERIDEEIGGRGEN